MASLIAIVEDSTAGRLSLGSRLSASHYKVETTTVADWTAASEPSQPDLVILGPSVDEPAAVAASICKRLGRTLPTLVLRSEASGDERLDLISKGIRDVFPYPVAEKLLLARVRALLREAEALREIERRRFAAMRFGFAEAAPVFAARKRVTFVFDRKPFAPIIDFGGATNWCVVHASSDDIFATPEEQAASSAYVLDWRNGATSGSIRDALPELRARRHSRHAAILVLFDPQEPDAAVHALDAGATDIIPGTALSAEVACRISRALKQKVIEDALRQSSEDTLELAMTDRLTGLYNRLYAEGYLADLVNRRAENQPFALMMADIDHFKSINDRFGHAAGDLVLKEVANRLRSEVRSVDLVARYGGEEFLMVLSESDLKQAELAAHRLRRTIGRTPVALDGSVTIDVTMSIGVSLGDHAELARLSKGQDVPFGANRQQSMSDLLSRADKALYKAKALGRNRVQLAASPA